MHSCFLLGVLEKNQETTGKLHLPPILHCKHRNFQCDWIFLKWMPFLTVCLKLCKHVTAVKTVCIKGKGKTVHQSYKPPQLSNKHLIMLIKFFTHGKHLAECVHAFSQELSMRAWRALGSTFLISSPLYEVLPLRPNSSACPTSPLLQVLKHLPVFIFTCSSKLPVFNAGAFLRLSSPLPVALCFNVKLICTEDSFPAVFLSATIILQFSSSFNKEKKINLFSSLPNTLLSLSVLHSLSYGIYSMTFKVHGFNFSTTDPTEIEKNAIYFFIIYVSVLDQTSKEHSRNLSKWLLEVSPFD